MRTVVPTLFFLLQLCSCGGTRRSRCGAENLDDFSHVIAGYASKEERCVQCEAAMAAYRCKGFEYMYGELKKMCENDESRVKRESCLESLEMYKDEVRYLLWDLRVTDPEACRFVLGCGEYNNSIYNWEFYISAEPYPTEDRRESTPFSVLHLTDTHVSTQYEVGASFDCEDELCCTDRQVAIGTKATAAGPYGDIRGKSYCDLPMRTLKNLLMSTKSKDFTHVYLTGDFIPHTSFNYTFERIKKEIAEQTRIISEGFVGHQIFPTIGNHDDYPAHLFPTHKMHAGNYSIDKLYNALWEIWSDSWIPYNQMETFKKGGYYSARAEPGLRIISMNTIYCYKLNWWLAVNPKDPEDQLEWLTRELEEAASKGERVHLLGHVPPGTTECKHEWAAAYQKIIARFRNVITGQFFGHMHWDMFSVDFAPETDEPTGVQLAAPSATTFMTGYPSYRIMHFGKNAELIDMDTYLLNLTEVNAVLLQKAKGMNRTGLQILLDKLELYDFAHARWQLEYSFKKQYGMPDLSPGSFAELINRMRGDDELLSRYYRSYFQHRHELPEINCREGSCEAVFYYDPGTRHAVVCEMYSTGTEQQKKCLEDFEKGASASMKAGIFVALGGISVALIMSPLMLSFD